jgi:hypothetical protein
MSPTADHERAGHRAAEPIPPDDTAQLAQQGTAEPLARIEAAMAELDGLADRSPGEHVAAFENLHLALTDALSAIDGV